MFKKLAIAAAAIALTAGAASANTFGLLSGAEQGDAFYDVKSVNAGSAGTIQIESLSGDVLGQAFVNAGANTSVRVDFGADRVGAGDLVAKLIVNGQVVDMEGIEVRR